MISVLNMLSKGKNTVFLWTGMCTYTWCMCRPEKPLFRHHLFHWDPISHCTWSEAGNQRAHKALHECGVFRLRSSYWHHKCCYPQSYFQSPLFMLIFLKGSKMLAFRNWKLLEVVFVMSWWAYFCQSVLKWTHHIQISFLRTEEIFNLVYLHHYRSVFRLFICKCTIWGTIKCWQSRLQSYQLQCIFHNFSNWHLWW